MQDSYPVKFTLRFDGTENRYEVELNPSDSFQEIVRLAEKTLNLPEDRLQFVYGYWENLRFKSTEGKYYSTKEVYHRVQGTNIRKKEPVEIRIYPVIFS